MQRFHPSSPYKTISSDSDTKHGTTNKKKKERQKSKQRSYQKKSQQQREINQDIAPEQQQKQIMHSQPNSARESSKNRKNYHLNSLNNQIAYLKNLKLYQIHKKRYRSASATNKKLKQAIGEAKFYHLKRLSLSHQRQRIQVKTAHQLQMKKFHQVWNGIFDYFQEKKNSEIAKWQRQKEAEYDNLRRNLTMKYHSIRCHSRELIDLEKEEKGLIRLQRFEDLYLLKLQKKRIKRKMEIQKNKAFMNLVQVEDDKFKKTQTKRYNSLMMRLEDSKRDANKKFTRDQLRLKQKYKNVLSHLDHEHVLEMNELLGKTIV